MRCFRLPKFGLKINNHLRTDDTRHTYSIDSSSESMKEENPLYSAQFSHQDLQIRLIKGKFERAKRRVQSHT